MDTPSSEVDFHSWLTTLDFDECEPRLLKLLIYFLQENKSLATSNCDLRERLQEAQRRANLLEANQGNSISSYLFPSRGCFQLWVTERFHEIETGLTLLEQHYPRLGVSGARKTHVDFFFQDINDQYLLMNLYFYDRRLRDDPMNVLSSLNEAQQHVENELCVSQNKIRKMIVANSTAQGIEDICTVNHTEFVCIEGSYRLLIGS
ncbi:hypothetical protein HOF92_00500 [bacterium]|jgi:hypothetical protein|nr:hypothetical protein [bacterium]